MASGTIVGTTSKHHTCVVKWSSSKGTGGSTVTATVYNRVSGTWRYNAGKPCSVTVDGTTVNGTLPKVWNNSGDFQGATCSKWVAYTGNKNIIISGRTDLSGVTYVTDGSKVGVRTCSQSVALDKVGEKPPSVSFTSPTTQVISEQGGQITVSWNRCNDYSGAAKYGIQISINGGGWSRWKYDIANSTTSVIYTIPAGQGNSYRFAIECYNDIGYSSFSYSGTVTTNKLSPPDIDNIDTFNPFITSSLSVGLSGGSQLNNENFVRLCALYYGDTWLWEASYSSTSWNNTSILVNYSADNYASKIGTSAYKSGNFRIIAWTENANRSRSEYVSKYFTVDLNTDGGATPTLSALTLSGGILNNPSTCFLAKYTPVTVTSGAASLRRAPSGTSLKYTIHCTGMYSVGGSSATFEILSAGERTATVTVTDSRGLSTSVTKKFMVQSYAPPVIKTIEGSRLDSPNTSGKVVYTLTYSPIYQYTSPTVKGNQLNGISVQQITKDGTKYVNYSTGSEITGLDTELAYQITLRISDNVYPESYITKYVNIPTIKSILSIRKPGIGIQCIPQEGFSLDVNGNVRFNSPITTNLNTSTYVSGSKGKAIINSTNNAGGYTTFLKGNSTNGAFTLSTYKDVIRLGYQTNDSITAGTNSLTKYIDILAEDGTTSLNNLKVTGEIHVGSTFGAGEGTITGTEIGNDGHMELSGSAPYIDFHYNNSSSDYTSRIIADGTSTLSIVGNAWVGNVYISGGSNSEWIGFYNAKGGTRYTWIGRNSTTNTKFYFNGEDNVTQFYFNKDISIKGSLASTSDLKEKENIESIDNAMDFIMNLEPIKFTFKDGKRIHMGFGAQPVAKVAKELNMGDLAIYKADIINEEGSPSEYYDDSVEDDKLSWSLAYDEFIAPLVAVVQEQQKEIQKLNNMIGGVVNG